MGQSPHGGKYEIRTENEKILAEEVGRPIAEVARGRAYLSECAVYGKLIDGLAEYGARWAKEDGFPEMAEEMEKRVGISKGIEKIIEPQAPKRSRGYEMEL